MSLLFDLELAQDVKSGSLCMDREPILSLEQDESSLSRKSLSLELEEETKSLHLFETNKEKLLLNVKMVASSLT